MAAEFVSPHVVVVRKAFGLFQGRRVPEPSVNPGDRTGGGNQFRPAQTPELVAIPSIADELQQQESIGTTESSRTRKQPRGQFSLERGQQSVGGKFAFKNPQFSGPLPALGDVAADLKNIAMGISLAGGDQNPAQKAGGAGKGFDQKTGRPGRELHAQKVANPREGNEISSVIAGRGGSGT